MIELLLSNLQEKYKLSVLSRGYRRKSKGFILANDETLVEDIGDEPFQILRKFPKVAMAVDENRRNGIKKLQELIMPDIILLDDAYQHRKVKPSFSILLTTYQNLYVDDWYLPTGDLRDSKSASKRANIIVVTKCPETITENEQQKIEQKLRPGPHQKVLFSFLEYNETILFGKVKLTLDYFMGKKLTLVTGIANPEPLVNYLKGRNIVFDHISYPDHHFFTQKELSELEKKEYILTTEKDFVRLSGALDNLYVIGVKHSFKNNADAVMEREIEQLMKEGS